MTLLSFSKKNDNKKNGAFAKLPTLEISAGNDSKKGMTGPILEIHDVIYPSYALLREIINLSDYFRTVC